MSSPGSSEKRQSIIDACLRMNQLGINQGTSGNISLRHEAGMLITPTSVPYEAMRPEQIVYMGLDGSFDPHQRPSSEWRFHRDILKARSCRNMRSRRSKADPPACWRITA
jgi:L-fuculose-phosphate aldolase